MSKDANTYFAGFVKLGDTSNFPINTVNSSDVPTDADSAPTVDIYDHDMGSVLLDDETATNITTGAYYLASAITSGNGFASNKAYVGVVSYAISSAARQKTFTFFVV